MTQYKFKVNDQVYHECDETRIGVICKLKTLFDVVKDESLNEQERIQPWYGVYWLHYDFVGHESEDSLVLI